MELGVGSGNSTLALLAATLETGGKVWSVDVEVPASGLHFDPRDVPDWSYTLQDDLDPEVVAACPRPIDCLFIDSDHHYEHTLQELTLYVPLMRPGGVLMMHDTESWPDGVGAAIRRFTEQFPMSAEKWLPESNGLYVGWL